MEIYDHVAYGRREPQQTPAVYDNQSEADEYKKIMERHRSQYDQRIYQNSQANPQPTELELRVHRSIVQNFENFYFGKKFYNSEGSDGHSVRYNNRIDPVTSDRVKINTIYYNLILRHLRSSRVVVPDDLDEDYSDDDDDDDSLNHDEFYDAEMDHVITDDEDMDDDEDFSD